MASLTLFEKIWRRHEVEAARDGRPAVLYIDLHLIHEVTSPQAFSMLEARGIPVARPARTLATIDHSTPTAAPAANGERPWANAATRAQVEQLLANCQRHGITVHGWDSPHRGIVHVMAPELGHTQPGMTIVCGDSHTSTHGAFGALAFGIGTTEVAHVLATQCLLKHKPRTLAVHVDGQLAPGVSAKDLALHVIGVVGVDGGTGHVIEFRGSTIRALSMEGRMTLCNLSIEMGAPAGLIAPDATTIEWLRGRPAAPAGADFERVASKWLTLASDPGARYDREIHIDASAVRPTVTWGTDPGKVVTIDGRIPADAGTYASKALAYMGFAPGEGIAGRPVDVVFIGSCTNARLPDLREAAAVLEGRHVHPRVRMLVVPGSEAVKRAAEAEGLDRVFRAAGAEWREPGCSMCIGMNGDIARPGELVVSTSNRNFEGRQGPGVRTVLASPATAAASAVAGVIASAVTIRAEEAA
jgi:3-isopropylmalate/(R)-2-methylmalate dehydratase large subunit